MGAVDSEPYYTQIDGRDLIVSVVAVPVVIDGEFYGVVGLEWTASQLQETFEKTAADQELIIRWSARKGLYGCRNVPIWYIRIPHIRCGEGSG
jgi:hypothetical protein